MLDDAIQLAEDHLVAYRGGQASPSFLDLSCSIIFVLLLLALPHLYTAEMGANSISSPVPELPYPSLLFFFFTADGSCSIARRCGMCATLAGEAGLGLSKSAPCQGVTDSGEGPAPPLLGWGISF